MTIPGFVAAGTGVVITTTGGSASVAVTAGASGRLIMLHHVLDGSGIFPTLSGLTNVTDLAGGTSDLSLADPGDPGIGASSEAGQRIWFGWSTASAVSLTATLDGAVDGYFRMYAFSDVFAGTSVDQIVENIGGFEDNFVVGRDTSTSVLDSIVVTNGVDRLALNIVGINDDLTGLAAFAGETGGDWVLATPIYETGTGTDATLALMIADMPTAGTINGGSDTITSDAWGVIGTALIGTTVGAVEHPRKLISSLQAVRHASSW